MARGDAELPALRVGVDIVEVERIAGAVARWGDRFLRRVFTPEELAYCQGNIPSLAARWAAKEAVVKALETGAWREGIRWTDVEVLREGEGPPRVRLHGAARQRAEEMGLRRWALSLSHSRTAAIAFVVAWSSSNLDEG
jgi:holo-[acyl-carrier protein] synthase